AAGVAGTVVDPAHRSLLPAGQARSCRRISGAGQRRGIERAEARVVKETLIRHRWNKSKAAAELGLSRVGLRNKLVRYGLERE
ncbi:MAG: hypothetical protein OSW77_14560, partial [Proteobacteria bacterium]|nr:hypothetical protein [Pseudomonadota bacterium]